MQSDILRDKFLNFFKSKRHKIIESDSLIPKDDPTVLFTPAGMNQFKKEFLGFDSGFKRAATAQRCLRTDDLDKVGKTTGHHTFFEMLGNFSFGDYFKEEAIDFAWEFLTEELRIKKDKLWISVYKDDDEAYKIWKDKIKIPAAKIIKLSDKENFWPSEARQKGPNGPCGPCSEIFFDEGTDFGCLKPDCHPSCNCGRFVEVWNLVFTQFNRKEGGVLEALPKRNIDTGMGLERLAAVMQGVRSNFQTDLFQPIIKEIETNVKLEPREKLIYAVSDHIRAIVFAIYDGVLPSNEGRGYVLRKLIRKSIIHLWTMKIKKPFLYTLVGVLAQIMKATYPQLLERRENISEIILGEEKNFISIFQSSETLFKEKFVPLFNKQNPQEAGKIAFKLYDTYGIPVDCTIDWLKKNNLKFSHEAFNQELQAQKSRSKLQPLMKGDIFSMKDLCYAVKNTRFLGYKVDSIKAKIIKIIKNDTESKKLSKNDAATIILDKTVFYPESGGQLGDVGELIKRRGILKVLETKKVGEVFVHIGVVKEGTFNKGDFVLAKINTEHRLDIARNHTATHLLQSALRKVLGAHVKQSGSLVAHDRLRFDFTHFKDIDKGQLDRIEELVNNYIISNYLLVVKQMPLLKAKREGALAFFGEKYESRVRVVSISNFSKELCAGTHLPSTGSIGIFRITQEGSVASGVRRIEALTGTFAYKIIKEEEAIIEDVVSQLNAPKEKISQELIKRLSRIKELEKQLNLQKLEKIKNSLDTLIQNAQKINNTNIITQITENSDMSLLRNTLDLLKQKTAHSVIVLGSKKEGSALLVMGITDDLVQKGLDASKLILTAAEVLGGSGGGRKDFAQAGGNRPENFGLAFEKLKDIIKNLMS